jgi:hypothetical protein
LFSDPKRGVRVKSVVVAIGRLYSCIQVFRVIYRRVVIIKVVARVRAQMKCVLRFIVFISECDPYAASI